MIRADFLILPDGRLLGFRLAGHAGWGEEGTDIVCAAVSSAAYLVANTVTDVLGVAPLSLRAGEGEMLLRLEERDEPACRDFLRGLKLHLCGLEEQYPAHMKVSYLEI
ncbi:MAG: ribosomal-processing cysteine protease Prp [Acutalibacter sp.]|jgi:uncharacterized protein YsxB (DUF464 family)|nr:ribosomal-processing cysteine protease Prp [Acutalibacter sp.]